MRLISELRRRNVDRMAMLYAVAAWLVMQVAEVIVTLASLPAWSGQAVLTLLAIGFPIALILSWVYELTPEGITLEKDIKRGKSITHITGRRLDFIVIALLCAAVIVFSYDKWWLSGPPITSVAVLPLSNLGVESDHQFIADGLTDVLTAELGQIAGLRVISRTSAMRYKAADKLLPEIAQELNVDALVEGSVQPSGNKVLFTLQLIDGRTDRHVWSGNYQRDLGDILTLQGEVAYMIANAIEATLTSGDDARLSRNRATADDAIRLWVIGNHHLKGFEKDSFNKALQAFEEAIRRDPNFAHAYAGIAQAYAFLGGWHATEKVDQVLPLAKAAAEKAIELDPDLAEAHFALGMIHRAEWAWAAADREFTKGLELNPSDTAGLVEYANFLSSLGRFNQAAQVARHAVELDPFSPSARNELGDILSLAGDEEAGIEHFNQALDLDPEFFQTRWLLADHHVRTGEFNKALSFMEGLRQDAETEAPNIIGMIGYYYALMGRDDEALYLLAVLMKRSESEYVQPTALAYVYAGLGDYDETIRWLRTAYESRDVSLIWLKEDPLLKVLHGDARFEELVSRMNFPDTEENSDSQKL